MLTWFSRSPLADPQVSTSFLLLLPFLRVNIDEWISLTAKKEKREEEEEAKKEKVRRLQKGFHSRAKVKPTKEKEGFHSGFQFHPSPPSKTRVLKSRVLDVCPNMTRS